MSTVLTRAREGGLKQGDEWLWGYAKITREGYEGKKECDSRPVPRGCELLQNVRAVALCYLNTTVPLTSRDRRIPPSSRCCVDHPTSCLPPIIVRVFAINQTFRCSHRQKISLSLSVCWLVGGLSPASHKGLHQAEHKLHSISKSFISQVMFFF